MNISHFETRIGYCVSRLFPIFYLLPLPSMSNLYSFPWRQVLNARQCASDGISLSPQNAFCNACRSSNQAGHQ